MRTETAVSCANGTDALALALMAQEKLGDAVFCPSFTFVATAQLVAWLGVVPVWIDILPNTHNVDRASLEASIARARAKGKLTPRVVTAVDLLRQPADYPAIKAIREREGLKLIVETAQGYGCTLNGKHPTDWADIATTRFFPAKPLGCYGNGGAIVTNDSKLAGRIESLRVYGKVTHTDAAERNFHHDPTYLSLRVEMNSRLDAIQAAALLEELKIFADEITARERIARRQNAGLRDHVRRVAHVIRGGQSLWAHKVIEHNNRDGLKAHLNAQSIPSMVYYPVPIHMQDFAAAYAPPAGALPVTEEVSRYDLALPMHPYLSEADQDRVIDAVRYFNG